MQGVAGGTTCRHQQLLGENVMSGRSASCPGRKSLVKLVSQLLGECRPGEVDL